ncbi:iron ABC transporter permease [Robiginitalea aurantiaca]|uniref:Iron ABC transporter permease n=1 Tax=Robiginitalea aurantiaca TaxID=3056915 RepID=A0ABT7WCD5_9FLAO|nr:iron ABC transporter permease [Robiginitalea aurantiaca]MDM9630563.1 iron ABC transporter permease [Robiginitalea aurantiaca]
MKTSKNAGYIFGGLFFLLILACLANLSLGSVPIPLDDILGSLFGGEIGRESWRYIIWNYRLPKALTALLVGGGLSLSGLLMQTLFRNPLAGPFVLGVSSGASLGAAILIMGASLIGGLGAHYLTSDLSLILASGLGSLLVLFTVLVVATRLKDAMALLIVGLMFGSITAALVTVLSYFSPAEQLQQYIFWSYGSVGNLSWTQVGLLAIFFLAGVGISVGLLKALNALLLGERYAASMGISTTRTRNWIILATGLLAGGITAFAGPIAFIGLAVPHLARQLLGTQDHRVLLPAVLLYGGILMLLCDMIAQLPFSAYVLPINAITSLVGAPVIIWLLIRQNRMVF